MKVWTCSRGHRFEFGDEDWHADVSQGTLDDGSLIPMFCEAFHEYTDEEAGIYKGEPCLDSSSLIWE